jgi:hypothetical protein
MPAIHVAKRLASQIPDADPHFQPSRILSEEQRGSKLIIRIERVPVMIAAADFSEVSRLVPADS